MLVNSIKDLTLSLPRFIKRGIVIFSDLLLCGLTVWIAIGLRLDLWNFPLYEHWRAYFAACLFSIPLFIFFGLYRAIFRYVGSAAFLPLVKAFVLYSLLYFLVFSVIGANSIPRSIGVIQPTLLFISIGISRYFIRIFLGSENQSLWVVRPQSKALIFGANSDGRLLANALLLSGEMKVVGFVDEDPHFQGGTIDGVPVFPNNNLQSLLIRLGISDVLLAIPFHKQSRRKEVIAALSDCNVRVRALPGLVDMAAGRVELSELQNLDMNDLLGRKAVSPDIGLMQKNICNKTVLVTGAGGSIGSELCRQIIKLSPKSLILVDNGEHSLYLIYEELKKILDDLSSQDINFIAEFESKNAAISMPSIVVPCLASVRNSELMAKIFLKYRPDSVFHAAAYKHVPLVEQNISEGIRNNVMGVLACAKASIDAGVTNFTLISTDKAVRPTNIMGASKRIAELVIQSFAHSSFINDHKTCFSMVRFGNVLGSSGSVAPLFSSQIRSGGPITLTHPDITRYFMTIPEAAQLVIQASSMATGGDVFVLDMGEPVRIYDLAVKMIYLSGLIVKDESNPKGDIEIKITGLRPGEKLYEELLIGNDPQPTEHSRIMKARENFIYWEDLEVNLRKLQLALDSDDLQLLHTLLKKLVPGYVNQRNIGNSNVVALGDDAVV